MIQIATTIEQSKKILALGVSPETADMHYYQIGNLNDWVLTVGGQLGTNNDIPAWSLSALYGLMKRATVTVYCCREGYVCTAYNQKRIQVCSRIDGRFNPVFSDDLFTGVFLCAYDIADYENKKKQNDKEEE